MKQISVTECAKLIQQYSATTVDIRDKLSYDQGHIEGSHRIDNQNLADFIAEADLDQPLIVCCYHGHSSIPAANFLEQQGFDEVYSMDGGMTEWGLSQQVVIDN